MPIRLTFYFKKMYSTPIPTLKKVYLLLLLTCLSGTSTFATRIVYPGRACPAIRQIGQNLNILYQNDKADKIDSIIVQSSFVSAQLILRQVEMGHFEYDSYTRAAVNQKIEVNIPTDIPADLYDLLVYSENEVHRSAKALKIVKEFNAQHRFIHISDPHVSRQWVGTAEDGYAKELELLDRFVTVANIIAPDFVIVTGDLIHDYTRFDADSVGWGGYTVTDGNKRPVVEEKYRNYFEGSHGFRGVHAIEAPVFSSTGNHDFYGLKPDAHLEKARQWNDLLGKRVYGFSYADTRVLVADDCLGDPLTEYPSGKLASGPQGQILSDFLKNTGPGQTRILAIHKPNAIDTVFCDQHQIAAVLHGHVHTPHEYSFGTTPTLAVRSGSISRSGSVSEWEKVLGHFRIFSVEAGELKMTPPLRFCTNPVDPIEKLEVNLTTEYSGANDGSLSANNVVVHNRFPVDLKNCRIRFLMKKGVKYQVSGGRIEQVIDAKKLTVVDVRFDLAADEKLTLACQGVQ